MKSQILLLEEFKQKLVEDINNSQLPSYLLEYVLRDMLSQVIEIKNNDIIKAKEELEKSKTKKGDDK